MNIMKTSAWMVGLGWVTLALSVGQTTDTSQATSSTNAPAVEQSATADQPSTNETAVAEKPTETPTATAAIDTNQPAGEDELRLNFRGAQRSPLPGSRWRSTPARASLATTARARAGRLGGSNKAGNSAK